MKEVELRFVDDAEAVARAAAEELAAAARRGAHVALSGGGTPRRAYELAAEILDDWSAATLWFGDDRCVPPDHEDSNYRMVREALLDRIARPPAVRRIEGELDPDEAARRYDEQLRGVTIDLALMGLGPDGHTASLFPEAPELDERERRAVAAEAGMEPFVPRVTMTVPVFEAARSVLFLVVGEEKADAAARAFGSAPSPRTPASLTRSREGRTAALLDPAAAIRLRGDAM
ncbi:MAG TPA: 6-phosphogluconolactonase [Gaiellaceae bacterium]|nr:6-phosphogluconolactonase [Gaiellaceae bacterium]